MGIFKTIVNLLTEIRNQQAQQTQILMDIRRANEETAIMLRDKRFHINVYYQDKK